MIGPISALLAFVVLLVIIVLANAIRVVREYERLVLFRLGRLKGERGPGLVLLWPIIDRAIKVGLRTVTMDVPPQDIITKDNVSVKVNAVIYFRVIDAAQAVVQVENFLYATSQIAQTTLRSILGQQELDELLSEREKLNQALQQVIDRQTEPWGIKVTTVEVKNVDLPQEMQRAIARQAEAERERRAKVINAEGEYQAAARLAEAASVISREPAALQLRYLQTLSEIATENNSTTIFPVPVDFLKAFMTNMERKPAER
jgi:regulator of protease activity HflC (stomatin/prohibitin superfamily)